MMKEITSPRWAGVAQKTEMTDEAGKTEGGSGPYFLARRGWQLVPEHAAATPTHSLQLLCMYVCSMCVHFKIPVWEALWMSSQECELRDPQTVHQLFKEVSRLYCT